MRRGETIHIPLGGVHCRRGELGFIRQIIGHFLSGRDHFICLHRIGFGGFHRVRQLFGFRLGGNDGGLGGFHLFGNRRRVGVE